MAQTPGLAVEALTNINIQNTDLSTPEALAFLHKTLLSACTTGTNDALASFSLFRKNVFAVVTALATKINAGTVSELIEDFDYVHYEGLWIWSLSGGGRTFARFYINPDSNHVTVCRLLTPDDCLLNVSLGYSNVNGEAVYKPYLHS